MTNSWNDIKNADVVIIMGGNAAEAHPCGFKWVTEAKANNGAKLIVVDPRFTRSAAVADVYAPIRPGTDIAFLSGVMRYLLTNGKIHQEYVKAFTNASYIVKEGYDFQDGLFTGYDETRNACPYCAVACGVLIYSLGDKSKNAKSSIIHVEGDPDHPVNRGTLCARGAASLGYIHSANRLKYPMHRKPGTDKFERVSWDFALDRITKLMKEDRDKNFIAKNRDGVTVNRWLSTGFFGGSSLSNEAGYLTYKFVRATGILGFEDQARI